MSMAGEIATYTKCWSRMSDVFDYCTFCKLRLQFLSVLKFSPRMTDGMNVRMNVPLYPV